MHHEVGQFRDLGHGAVKLRARQSPRFDELQDQGRGHRLADRSNVEGAIGVHRRVAVGPLVPRREVEDGTSRPRDADDRAGRLALRRLAPLLMQMRGESLAHDASQSAFSSAISGTASAGMKLKMRP